MISQPRYLPALTYLHRMSLCDLVVYLDTVQYSPRVWENRNRIKSATGPCWLSVPVIHQDRKQQILETRISPDHQWQSKHINTLENNYRKATYFPGLLSTLMPILQKPWTHLVDLNITLTNLLLKELGVSVPYVRASQLANTNETGTRLLIELCKMTEATHYLSGPLGRNYITESDFHNSNIRLIYHDYVHPIYPQLYGDFIPNLSIVDLLFNTGQEARSILNKNNWSCNSRLWKAKIA